MGFFDRFKKENRSGNASNDNGISGPTYFDGVTEEFKSDKKVQTYEWRRRLKSQSGQTKFKIKYYGQLHPNDKALIVGTDFAPALVLAVDSVTGQEILLFDGCRH